MSADSLLQTPLHAWHRDHGGRLVEFGGWSMPVQYTTIVDEHQAVRKGVGLFDISHMGRLRFSGPGALGWLDFATTNHVQKLKPGQIQYSVMVKDDGGVIDDILVYRLRGEDRYGVVCNASNRANVVSQFITLKDGRDAEMIDETLTSAMIAVQGPKALDLVSRIVSAELAALPYYHHTVGQALGVNVSVSRTGYTGEDGFELVLPNEAALAVWETLLAAGADLAARACGLGARDTLRFEAAMPLYGHEMDETVSPYAAGLGWAVKLNKGDFVGRDALVAAKKNPGKRRVGIALEGKRIARQGSSVSQAGNPVGVVTSGTFSPTLGQSLAMASVDIAVSAEGTALEVDVRGHSEPARIVRLPFYHRPVGS